MAGAAASDEGRKPTDAEAVVEARGLGRTFGHLVAVRDLSLTVRRGEIFGVLGPNGAGKSTTIRMLCGILDPTAGSATVVGYDVAREPDRVKERIGYMTQRFSLYEDLSVEENLKFFAGLYGVPWKKRGARVEEAMRRGGLTERRSQIAGTLSGGWKQRVALASSTIHEPPLLFLDEPTAGVDPVSRREFWEQIHILASEGTTVLVTTHYMDEAERCHRLAFIFRGTVLATGTPTDVVRERGLAAVELSAEQATRAAALLRATEAVDQVSHFGHGLRVVVKPGHEAKELVLRVLGDARIPVTNVHASRVSVEDAFISMVGEHTARDAGEGRTE